MLVAILNTCAQDDPEEIAEEVKKIQMEKKDVPEEIIEEELDDATRRREIIKNKIRAVGKVQLFMLISAKLNFIVKDGSIILRIARGIRSGPASQGTHPQWHVTRW